MSYSAGYSSPRSRQWAAERGIQLPPSQGSAPQNPMQPQAPMQPQGGGFSVDTGGLSSGPAGSSGQTLSPGMPSGGGFRPPSPQPGPPTFSPGVMGNRTYNYRTQSTNNRFNTSNTQNIDNSIQQSQGERRKMQQRPKPFNQQGYGMGQQMIGNPGYAVQQLKMMNSLLGLG